MDNKSLVADMLIWIAREPKPYNEVMDAWRTSCPRLSVWEDAVDHGFVEHKLAKDNQDMIHVTAAGKQFLKTLGSLPN